MENKSNQTKKFIVLFATFIVPLLFFLLLSSGEVNFKKLPILTKNVEDIFLVSDDHKKISFRNKITVLSFLPSEIGLISFKKILNLYQVIYKPTEKYKKFQIITIIPKDNEFVLEKLRSELKKVGGLNLPKWHFIQMKKNQISKLFESMKTPYILDSKKGLSEVFIIDEDLNLRGRLDDEESKNGILFGYDTNSISILKNKLNDDLKVVFYESKFAIK